MNRLLKILTLSVLFYFFTSQAWGIMVLPLDLPGLTKGAGKIFVGRCLETQTDLDENRIPSTYIRFQVLQGLKGVQSGEEVLVKQYGVEREPLWVREGGQAIVPPKSMTIAGGGYREGQSYLLFYYPESRLGFTSPVGGGQGKFQILEGEEGVKLAVNPLGNRFIKGLFLAPETGGVELDRILEKVERLVGSR